MWESASAGSGSDSGSARGAGESCRVEARGGGRGRWRSCREKRTWEATLRIRMDCSLSVVEIALYSGVDLRL
jgi:hypothetical protein